MLGALVGALGRFCRHRVAPPPWFYPRFCCGFSHDGPMKRHKKSPLFFCGDVFGAAFLHQVIEFRIKVKLQGVFFFKVAKQVHLVVAVVVVAVVVDHRNLLHLQKLLPPLHVLIQLHSAQRM